MNTKPIGVYHQKLVRTGESIHKSECPFCLDGIFLMRRDEQGHLLTLDVCVGCGTSVEYLDMKPNCICLEYQKS